MYSNKLYTPLRYPGGKARFAPFIARVFAQNKLTGGHYLEPYAGGAGVALELLYHGVADHIHINDLDPAVYSFWKVATQRPDELLGLLEDTPVTMDEWHKWRAILRGEADGNDVEKGFATLFLNRTNRSGILKGGVIGGKSQSGIYKLDARLKKDVIAARLAKIATHASRISVYFEDAAKLLRRAPQFLPDRSLIYLDPPYYVKGKGLYRNFYTHDDHAEVAQTLANIPFRWIVSYDDAPEIRRIYRKYRSVQYGLHYTAQSRYVGDEVMFFSPGLRAPKAEIPDQTEAA